jgi:hypothetical protein
MTTLKNWIKEQKNKLIKSEELKKQRQQKIDEHKAANIRGIEYLRIFALKKEDLECIPEHIFISKSEIIIYFDCDFQIIDYRIEKSKIKNKDDFIFWIEHLSGKNWVDREIIYEFVTKCKIL